jgi:predicted flavoprotein YhiN
MPERTPEVLILGGGAAGMFVALAAAARGLRVRVSDPMAATASNFAIIRYPKHTTTIASIC